MINFIKKLFLDKNKIRKELEFENFNDKLINQFLDKELQKVNYFLLDKREIILNHIKGKINLHKSDNLLTKEEKQKLGIDVRLKISKELIEVFDLTKLSDEDPKDLLSELFYKIDFKIKNIEEIERIKNADICKVELSSSQDERTCEWCLKMDNKVIDINKTDIIKLIDENCKCKYNRSVILAVFDE